MATLATLAPRPRVHATPSTDRPQPTPVWSTARWLAILAALSLTTLLVHGFHPLAEDGGLYVAGVEHLLNPALFPHDTAFVAAHLRFSVFAPLLAGFVRLTHIPLPWALLLAEILSISLTLFSARQLLRRCVDGDAAQLGGVVLLAAWWTLPVAATSLLLFDPYLTARSFSTPLSLLAIAYALDWTSKQPRVAHSSTTSRVAHSSQRPGPPADVPGPLGWQSDEWGPATSCVACLLLAALFHPLMAACAAALIAGLIASTYTTGRRSLLLCTLIAAFALAAAVTLHALAPAESPAVAAAAHSRYYWFLSQWRWYELCGLAGPLAVLALLGRCHLSRTADALCAACIGMGLIAVLIALFFAHDSAPTHLLARLQPLRIFLPIYAIMALLLGAALTRRALESQRITIKLLPAAAVVAIAALMFTCQRETFPASPHLELPWRLTSNPWSQAFLWIRGHTPQDALFAIDADYITTPGEDAQAFRATARRSVLPDFSKDGGEASITPALADQWQQGVAAQTGLSFQTDALRQAHLHPLGVTWLVLRSFAQTRYPCPYNNGTAKVCRLSP